MECRWLLAVCSAAAFWFPPQKKDRPPALGVALGRCSQEACVFPCLPLGGQDYVGTLSHCGSLGSHIALCCLHSPWKLLICKWTAFLSNCLEGGWREAIFQGGRLGSFFAKHFLLLGPALSPANAHVWHSFSREAGTWQTSPEGWRAACHTEASALGIGLTRGADRDGQVPPPQTC